MQPVSDPAILAQLNAPDTSSLKPVTDPAILNQLESVNWSDVPGQAAKNFLPSLGSTLLDIAQPIIHPIDTATNLKNLAAGVLQKTGLMSGEESIKYADAFGEYFKDRYGGEEGFKRTLAKDPAGVLADVSMLLTGGETALARAPGAVAKAAEVAGKVGRAIDPLNAITKPAAAVIRAADVPLGVATGAGPAAIQAARQAGREGGAASEAFTSQMRRTAPIEEVVTDAQDALDNMRKAKQAAYRQDMQALSRDRTVLDFADIDNAVAQMQQVNSFKGQNLSRSTEALRKQIEKKIDAWKQLDPADYHTPEGFDALKKSIGDLTNNIPFENKAARLIAKQAYDAVKDTIVKQAPGYADTMQAYERASRVMRELQDTFSLNPNKPIDTALRKLTSAMRNNVNTNFGRREALVQTLQAAGAPQLGNKIAGASLNSLTPRGLASLGPQAGIVGALTGVLPLSALSTLATSSPRLVGEAQHALGAFQRYGDRYGRPTLQSLRMLGRSRNYGDQ